MESATIDSVVPSRRDGWIRRDVATGARTVADSKDLLSQENTRCPAGVGGGSPVRQQTTAKHTS